MAGVAIATRPDCIDREKLDVIREVFQGYRVWMEYGLQSIHKISLDWMRRGHDAAAFTRAVKMTRAYPFRVCAHIIFGLPVETREMMLKTVDFLSETGVDDIKIHMLHILKGSPLEEVYRKTPFSLLDRETYISIVCDAIERLPESVVVQRLTGDAPAGIFAGADIIGPNFACDAHDVPADAALVQETLAHV
jgi:radical SAM protein (TIGR01212 family)